MSFAELVSDDDIIFGGIVKEGRAGNFIMPFPKTEKEWSALSPYDQREMLCALQVRNVEEYFARVRPVWERYERQKALEQKAKRERGLLHRLFGK